MQGLDLVVLVGSLVLVMAVGLGAGRRGEDSEEYFLAGRSVPWWGVAGSIFATNISAHHLVGMLGVGFSIGFAQSHYELGAVFALLLLAYVVLPVYTELRVYTLSQYLAVRYDERVALVYSVFTLVLIVVQATALLYIGSRSLNLLLDDSGLAPGYVGGIVGIAGVAAAYTVTGGLRAVIWTDVLQSLFLLAAGVAVAVLTFAQDEVGGFAGMLAHDAALPAAAQKMHLYLPASHPDLPWTGALSGLLVLHVSFWCTNQYIVQRTLAASSLRQARVGIVGGGWLKLSVPFFSIAGGVAAAQLFEARMPGMQVAPDDAFPTLMKLVLPAGWGLVGLVSAGLLGAILSTLDSLLNSGATLVVIDVYRKHLRPDAPDARVVAVGRAAILVLASLGVGLAATTYDPTSRGNFFLGLSRQISYLIPGMLVAFALGVTWPRARPRGALAAIAAAPVLGVAFGAAYPPLAAASGLAAWLGPELNFLHRTLATALACTAVHVWVSRLEAAGDPQAEARRFEACGGLPAARLWTLTRALAAWLAVGGLGALAVGVAGAAPAWTGGVAAAATFALFAGSVARDVATRRAPAGWRDDRLLAGGLAAATTFLLFAFA